MNTITNALQYEWLSMYSHCFNQAMSYHRHDHTCVCLCPWFQLSFRDPITLVTEYTMWCISDFLEMTPVWHFVIIMEHHYDGMSLTVHFIILHINLQYLDTTLQERTEMKQNICLPLWIPSTWIIMLNWLTNAYKT